MLSALGIALDVYVDFTRDGGSGRRSGLSDPRCSSRSLQPAPCSLLVFAAVPKAQKGGEGARGDLACGGWRSFWPIGV